jgi:uncharacterized repeat protein (TIGR01451 family)
MIMTGGAANKTSSSYLVWPVRGNLLHDIADLGISMSDADDPVAPGDPITYTLDVENLGPNTAAEVTVTGALPAGSAFVSAAGPGWACSEDTGVVTCSATGLGIGAAPSITVEIDAPSTPGTISTTFLVDSLQGDPVGDNNSDTEETDVAEYDFGDAPDPTYPTLQASNGARHVIGGSLYLGAAVDADADGQPTATANGDDTDPEGDDEDGITFTSWLVAGWTADIRITASEAGLVNAWIDFNADGDWSDPGEQIFADQAVVGGANNLTYTIPLNAMTGVDTYARFRINSSGGLSPEGEAADGEVEDHHVMIEALDYGDAPDPTYPTLQASDGARHIIGGLFLGASVDLEADGQPTAGADGDDLDGTDDEDGVVLTAGLTAGSSAPVDVTASGAGLLNAWVDLNADGDWDDTGEQIFTDEAVVAGVNSLSFAVPLDAALGTTFARFRLSTTPGLGFDGYATDGEVEDHAVDIVAPDLKMVVDDWPDPIPDGHRLTYFLRVHNEGQLDADGVTLTDTLPADGLFAAASHAGCSETGGVVTCNLGTIAAGTKVEVEVEFDIADGFVGTLTNDAVVTTTTPEPDTSNNTATETTTVVEEATFVHSGNFETGDLTGWIVVGLVP